MAPRNQKNRSLTPLPEKTEFPSAHDIPVAKPSAKKSAKGNTSSAGESGTSSHSSLPGKAKPVSQAIESNALLPEKRITSTVTHAKTSGQTKSTSANRKVKETVKPPRAKSASAPSSAASIHLPSPASKQSQLLALLSQGVSLSAMMDKTGWQAHSIRGTLSHFRKRLGLKIVRNVDQEGQSLYRIEA